MCLDHSCRTAEFQNRVGGPTGKIKSKRDHQALSAAPGESAYLIAKKRKYDQQQDSYKEAFKLINNDKMFSENGFQEKAGYLENIGIYEAGDLKDLGGDHIETLGALMKEIPRKRWTRLLTQPEKA